MEFLNVNATRTKLNNSKGFKYDANSHTYTLDGLKLKNTTSWVESFSRPFESYAISKRKAAKNKMLNTGIFDDVLLRKFWNLKGQHARELGSSLHTFCNMYWLDPDDVEPKSNYDVIGKNIMDAIMQNYDILDMEIPRGNRLYMMGYTMDLVARKKSTGEVILFDFKTNKYATAEQEKEDRGRLPQYLLTPFNTIRGVCVDKASIQLNAYKILHNTNENTNFTIDGCAVIHINPNPKYYGDKGFKVYPTLNISSIVEMELEKEKDYKMNVLGKI